jgi:rubredoxin
MNALDNVQRIDSGPASQDRASEYFGDTEAEHRENEIRAGFMFAAGRADANALCPWAPVVTDFCIAWLDCRVLETLDLGTHMLIIGQVADSGVIADGEPLTYRSYREKYKMVSPVNSPTYIEKEKLTPEEPPEKPSETPESPEEDDDDEPYICTICGHIYRPGEGDQPADIPPGTPFRKLPEDYRCPVCNAGKDYFRPMG